MARFERPKNIDYKSETHDPYDAVMPSKEHFIMKHYAVSAQRGHFHYRAGSMGYYSKDGQFTYASYGVDKRMTRASGEGYMADSQWAGKSET